MESLLHNFRHQLPVVRSKRFFKNSFLLYIFYTLQLGKTIDEHLGREKIYCVNEPTT